MAQANVAITAGAGTPIDVWVTATQAYNRQGIVLADPSTDAAATKVTNADPGATDYGPVVRERYASTISANIAILAGAISGTTMLVQGVPGTTNGLTIYRKLSAATTNGANVKASAGQLYGWYLYNANAATRYVKLYNTAGTPSVGTDTPVMTLPIPPGGAANVLAEVGMPFATGIGIGITTGVADNDTGAVALNEVVVQLFYK